MPRMLLDLQNRGQLAAGMATYNPDRDKLLDTYKDIGTVIEAFRLNQPAKYASHHGGVRRPRRHRHTPLRHLRRGTSKSYAQPFERRHGCKWKWFAFAFNGQLANFAELREQLLAEPRLPPHARQRHRSHHALPRPRAAGRRPPRPRGGVPPARDEVRRRVQPRLPERDGRHGRAPRPARASARCATRRTARCSPPPARASRCRTSASDEHQVARAGRDDPHPGRRAAASTGSPARRRTAHCFFEWIYFANVASTLDDRSVYLTPVAARAGTREAGTRAGPRAARRATRSSCRCRTPARPRPTRWRSRCGIPSRRGADPQPLHRPHVHRGRQPGRQGAAEVHAAARGAAGQAGAAGRGLDRPQHDAARACCSTCASRAARRRSTSGSRARRSSRRASTAST